MLAGETVALINRLDGLDAARIDTLASCVPKFFVSAESGALRSGKGLQQLAMMSMIEATTYLALFFRYSVF